MQTRTSLVHGTGVDEAYGLIHHGCGGSVLSVCVSRASHEISMTAFRERHFHPAETVKGSLTDADWVRLKKLVERARFWVMPERHCQSSLDDFVGRLRAESTMAITDRSAGRPAVAHSSNWGMLLVEFSGLEIPHDSPVRRGLGLT